VAFGLKRSFLCAQVSWSYEAAMGVGAEAEGCIKCDYVHAVGCFFSLVSHYPNDQTITRIYIQAGKAAAAA
jgi:hypothetical protein